MAQQVKQPRSEGSSERALGLFTGNDAKLEGVFHEWGIDTTRNPAFLNEVSFVVFTGEGGPVNPFLYGHHRHKSAGVPDTKQDMRDNRIYRMLDDEMPKFGFGRGAHFLNVMNGGTLYQGTDGHDKGSHMIRVLFNEKMERVTSFRTFMAPTKHTQMMIPSRVTQPVIMAQAASSTKRLLENREISIENAAGRAYSDHEVIYYYDSNSLCYQPDISDCKQTDPALVYFRRIFSNIMAASLGSSDTEGVQVN